MYHIEKFATGEGTNGVKVKFEFTPHNNTNGVYFNPLSVFKPTPVKTSNKNHEDNYEIFSDGTEMSLSEAKVDGDVLKYDAEYITTNKAAIEVITGENFSGFSPELISKSTPVPHKKAVPRFYKDGALTVRSWSILEGKNPSFKGAGDVQIETFSENSPMVIIEEFADDSETKTPETATQEAPAVEKPAEAPEVKTSESEKPKEQENFYSYCNVGEYVKVTSTKQVGKIIKIEQLEGGIQNITLKTLDNSEVIISDNQNNDTRILAYITTSDIMEYLINKNVESFSEEDEEDTKTNKIIENFDQNLKTTAMANAANSKKVSKQDAVDNDEEKEHLADAGWKKLGKKK